MQKIIGNVSDFGIEEKSITLTFTIVNRFLNPIQIKDVYNGSLPKQKTTITSEENGDFSLELWENDRGQRYSLYLITSTDEITLKAYIYIPFLTLENAHISILKKPISCENIISVIQDMKRIYKFSDEFIKELDAYLLNRDTPISEETKMIFDDLCWYADEDDESKKLDHIKTLDEVLGEYDGR